MRYLPENIVNIQAARLYQGRFTCKMQVAARGGFTMALLRPRNIEADDGHALNVSGAIDCVVYEVHVIEKIL
jgi:hypothetical protein